MQSACYMKRLARRRKRGAHAATAKSSVSAVGFTSTELAVCRGRLRRRPAQTSLMAAAEETGGNDEEGGGVTAKSYSVVAATIDRF